MADKNMLNTGELQLISANLHLRSLTAIDEKGAIEKLKVLRTRTPTRGWGGRAASENG